MLAHDASLNDTRAATDADLKFLEEVVVSGRRRATTVASWHPPAPFERAAKTGTLHRVVTTTRPSGDILLPGACGVRCIGGSTRKR